MPASNLSRSRRREVTVTWELGQEGQDLLRYIQSALGMKSQISTVRIILRRYAQLLAMQIRLEQKGKGSRLAVVERTENEKGETADITLVDTLDLKM